MDGRSSGLHGAGGSERPFRRETLDPIRRASGRHLDRVHEHRSGRQQETLSQFRIDIDFDPLHDYDVRGRGSRRC